MGYTNPKDLMIAIAALPAKIEEKLPEGAPSLSTMMVDAANKMPALPDFPVELPDLPPLPEMPAPPGEGAGLRRPFVTGVTVTPAVAPAAAPRSRRYLY